MPIHCWWEWKRYMATLKRVWQFNRNFNINLLILLIGICPKEMKIYAHKKTCTQKFIAVLFILEKTPETMQMSISG